MSSSVFVVGIGAIGALAMLAAIGYRWHEKNVRSTWLPVDLRAFARLLSKDDDEFLAEHLPVFTLFQVRIKRAIAAGEYLARLRSNCRHAIAAANQNPQSASELLNAATALRVEIAKLQLRVWLAVISPINADVQRLFVLNRAFADPSNLSKMPI
jgi:hypothetical protein